MESQFHPSACRVCIKTGRETKLKRCGQCGLVAYCGIQHQKRDWKNHRDFCKVISRMLLIKDSGQIPQMNNLPMLQTRLAIMAYCEMHLLRKLNPCESTIVYNYRCCNVCDVRNNLKDCPVCLFAFFCPDHVDFMKGFQHDDECQHLKLLLDLHVHASKGLQCPDFTVRSNYPTNNMDLFITKNIAIDEMSVVTKALISSRLSRPLTVVYALSVLQKQLPICPSIHIVGSNNFELMTASDWQLVPTLLGLKRLHLTFIGPEVIKSPKEDTGNLVIESSSAFYHEFDSLPPDLIVAFNCGFHEFEGTTADTWGPSLSRMLSLRVPLVLTSYTVAEAVKDVDRLAILDPSVRTRMYANPFASLLPSKDVESTGVYFDCNVLSIATHCSFTV